MSKITLSFMQRFMSNLDTAIRNFVDSKVRNKQDVPVLMSQTLFAGQESVTFTNVPTEGIVITDIYTSKAGLGYESIDDSTAGTIIVNYEAQEEDLIVFLTIERYE